MDVYLADGNFLPEEIVDDFESFVWKDGFRGEGDFEMTVPWRASLASDLKAYKYLTMSESDRVMQIENAFVERPKLNLKSNAVKITGKSIEGLLDLRDIKSSAEGGLDPFEYTASRGAAANYFVENWCISNANSVNNFPGWSVATPPTGPTVDLMVERGKVGDIVRTILLPDNLGFKLAKRYVNGIQQAGQLQFKVYKGVDLSNSSVTVDGQTFNGMFSPDGENLVDISTFTSIAAYKNHARMIGAKTGINVYAPGTLSTAAGYDRRTVVIEALDVGADSTTTVEEDQIVLTQRGLEALNSEENKYQRLVDGSVPQNNASFSIVGLGDIVWVRDSNGNQNQARIAEKVWTADRTGVKRLPTFEAV